MKQLPDRLIQKVAEIEERDPVLRKEFEGVRKKAARRAKERESAPLAEMAPSFSDREQFVAETIVLRTGRPVLAIRQDKAELVFNEEDSEVWKDRLNKAGSYLGRAIRAVGRVEVQHHPNFEWIGTGWLVAENIVVTNRHVAMEFGRRNGQRFVFRQGVGGLRMAASIDFLEEFDRAESLEFSFDRILHIEDEEGPDMAFIQVRPVGGKGLAQCIELDGAAAGEDEFVAVIGYPAQDSRIPEQQLMHQIFGDQYNKKRLAPGQVTGIRSDAVMHDCSTLGGNSGSVVLSLASGKALGLHFAGRFLEANYAVPARLVAERLREIELGEAHPRPSRPQEMGLTPSPAGAGGMNVSHAPSATGRAITYTIPLHVTVEMGMPMAGGGNKPGAGPTWVQRPSESEDGDMVLTEARPEDYVDRAGYDSDFIGQGVTVPLPDMVRDRSDILTFEFEGKTQDVLKYQHFSVLMSRSRRLCRYSAVNINGNEPRKAKRPAWRNDPRIPAGAQIAKECYGNPPKFSRGHMTRREDPIWGPQELANRGNADSMHVTNAVPQMQPFNAGIWLGLEDYALEHARQDDMRTSVFTGPFLRDDDPVWYRVQIPLSFWKVIAFIHDDTGELCATGYYMSQEDYLREEEFVFGQHKTAQVAIAWIEEQSGMSVGELTSLDPMALAREGPPTQLMEFSQIRFLR